MTEVTAFTIDGVSTPPGNFSVMQSAFESPVVTVPLVAVLAVGAVPLPRRRAVGGGRVAAGGDGWSSDLPGPGCALQRVRTTAVESGSCEVAVESSPELDASAA